MTEYIRTAEAAQLLQVTSATIVNMIDRGLFPGASKIDPTRRNSPYRIPKSEVIARMPKTSFVGEGFLAKDPRKDVA